MNAATQTLPSVLVVDDNRDAADSLSDLLSVYGAEVRTCYDAACALGEAESFAFEVAVLDIHMPVTDGCALARLLRAAVAPRRIYLIAMTGVSGPDARARTKAAGFDLHLTKASAPDDLLRALERLAAQ